MIVPIIKFLGILISALMYFKSVDAVCERSTRMLAAEDICWTSKVRIGERIQYTTKSVFNFAKEKLGFGTEESYHPQQCDYYECIFAELKMLNEEDYPNYDKILEWIDNNIIYKHATALYQQLNKCNTALARSVDTNSYFFGNLSTPPTVLELPGLQGNCEVLQEFMKCLAMEETDCIIFKYP